MDLLRSADPFLCSGARSEQARFEHALVDEGTDGHLTLRGEGKILALEYDPATGAGSWTIYEDDPWARAGTWDAASSKLAKTAR